MLAVPRHEGAEDREAACRTRKFKALVVDRDAEKKQVVEVRELSLADLMEGDVVVRVSHSTVNYKDGLAITGKLPVVRRFPMIPGVDFCGTVETSADPNFTPGDHVILNGWGCGETHYGAYAKYARVKGDWLIRKPDGMSSIDAMAIGTAGYTAMLSILALEHYGITPESGPMVVTGAVGRRRLRRNRASERPRLPGDRGDRPRRASSAIT